MDAVLPLGAFGIELPLYDGLSFPAVVGAPTTPAVPTG
jgi:hypothetical protein